MHIDFSRACEILIRNVTKKCGRFNNIEAERGELNALKDHQSCPLERRVTGEKACLVGGIRQRLSPHALQ